ncbi:MAG: GNAT family N-acetyltransferase [Candidatus Binatia bacterium]
MTQAAFPFTYEVRKEGQADVAELKRMRLALQAHFACANSSILALNAQRVAALTTFYRDLLTDPRAQVLVVQDQQGVQRIGMAIGRVVDHEEFAPTVWGHIDNVWVEPPYRHYGICRTLLARLLEFFAQAGVEVLVLDYVRGNREAEAVWRRFGFQEVLTVANAKLHEVKENLKREIC